MSILFSALSVIDYGVNNVGSVVNMLRRVGVTPAVARNPTDVATAAALVLPGVGAFDAGVMRLREAGLFDAIRSAVRERNIPILGVCLGMQLLTRGSEEGTLEGLALVPATTIRFRPQDPKLKIPHMGWNDTRCTDPALFAGLETEARFYYVHSYHVVCDDETNVAARCTYGIPFSAALRNGDIFGTQFHPEKSHRFGMKVFSNFVDHVAKLTP